MEQLDSYFKKKNIEGTNTVSKKAKPPIPHEIQDGCPPPFDSLLWISGGAFPGQGKSWGAGRVRLSSLPEAPTGSCYNAEHMMGRKVGCSCT